MLGKRDICRGCTHLNDPRVFESRVDLTKEYSMEPAEVFRKRVYMTKMYSMEAAGSWGGGCI